MPRWLKVVGADCCEPEPPDTSPLPEGQAVNDLLAAYAKALGHPARVEILRILLAHDRCACGDIVEQMPLAQSTISQHLKHLKEAGLIHGEVEGPTICYCVHRDALFRFQELLESLAATAPDGLLENMDTVSAS